MAEGLWESTLNACPRGLVELTGNRKPTEEDKRTVRLSSLQKYDYDLSHHMGTLLRERYHFDRLEGMRLAYAEAFPAQATEVHQPLANRALDTLVLVRNLIVHNGGIIDDAYLRRKSDLPQKLVCKLGSEIELDGEVVAQIIRPVIEAGQSLLQAVDQWISTSSPSRAP
jgi:hypothetical protein